MREYLTRQLEQAEQDLRSRNTPVELLRFHQGQVAALKEALAAPATVSQMAINLINDGA